MKRIDRVAIIGLGAVGASFAYQISHFARDLELYGVVRNLELYWGNPIVINNMPLKVNYRDAESLTAVRLDLILVCVKSYQLDEALSSIKELIGPETLIMSLMNGMTSGDKLAELFGSSHVVFSTLMNSDINRNGRYVTLNSLGTVIFGAKHGLKYSDRDSICSFFKKCRISYEISSDISYHLWKKIMIMAGFAQTSTVYQLTYGAFVKNEKAMDIMRTAQSEIIALANKNGVALSERDIFQWETSLRKLSPDGRSSMLQDYWMNRRLEIDAFGDYVCKMGEQLKVPMHANEWLRDQIHSMLDKRAEIPTMKLETKVLNSRKSLLATPEKIANQIRIDIIMAKFNQGERIGENDLAKRFKASRSSVRTALQMMNDEGMLRVLQNGRREVIGFGAKQVNDLYGTRWLIENRALEIIFNNKSSVYPELAEVLVKIEKKYNAHSDYEDWNDIDVQFHRSLVHSADNLFLMNAWNSMVQIMYALMQFHAITRNNSHYASEFFGDHRRLYEQLLAKDKAIFPELKRHIEAEMSLSLSIVNGFQR